METPGDNRDGKGRFAPGNPGGPGRRPERAAEKLRKAVEDAVTPEHLAAVMRRVLRMALEGNMTAIRIVLERTCGRPAQAPSEVVALDFDLPPLRSVQDCTEAADRVARAVCDGQLDGELAKVFLGVIQTRLKAIEVNDVEARLTELEKQAAVVELPRGGRRF